MLETLITNKTRLKLLLKFFLNSKSSSYLRNLETEFDESSNAIRIELNRFEEAGLLVSSSQQNRKMFRANTSHPLFPDLNSLLMKYTGFDQILDKVVHKLGGIVRAYITGDLARGKDSGEINLALVGKSIDENYMNELIRKAQKVIKRNITCVVLDESDEFQFILTHPEALIIWSSEIVSNK